MEQVRKRWARRETGDGCCAEWSRAGHVCDGSWLKTTASSSSPILNSPYEYPRRHWELDDQGQPTQQIIERRRRAEFITPIPKPRKRRRVGQPAEPSSSTKARGFRPRSSSTTRLRSSMSSASRWTSGAACRIPNDWQVTPETARLLQHWRHHQFSGIRPFFCQVEAVETAIWLTEVAPKPARPARAFWNTWPMPTTTPTRSSCAWR